ncbi:MAG: TetR family transcriptional regulator [Rhodobacter sp.]|nr:TetR family transcriptional regulator [Rhodobacter sp.]
MPTRPSSPRRSRDAMIADTTAKLVAAARGAFASRGFADTALADLCAEVGLTRGAVYHHFGGKEGLLEAVLSQINAEIARRLDHDMQAASDPWTAFRNCCLSYLDLALDPEIQRIVMRDAPAVLGQRFRDLDEASSLGPMTQSIRDLLERDLIRPSDPEALARLVNGSVLDAAMWVASANDPKERLPKAQQALATLLDGIARR